jgi:hypothetical protein
VRGGRGADAAESEDCEDDEEGEDGVSWWDGGGEVLELGERWEGHCCFDVSGDAEGMCHK